MENKNIIIEEQIINEDIIKLTNNIKNITIELTLNKSNLIKQIELDNEYKKYENLKNKSKNLDFDDLLIKCLEIIEAPEILEKLRKEIRHILVDEYQDTNYIQHEIIKALSIDKNKNLKINSKAHQKKKDGGCCK